VLTRNEGPLRLAGVKLDPRALRSLIGVPLGEFRDATLELTELGWRPLLALEDAVARARTAEQLARELDAFFLARLSVDVTHAPAVGPLVERLRASRGVQPILPWARAHAIDARTLERQFVASMGMTPKQFARVMRFKHTYHRLAAEGRGAVKAHLDAFYDEAHFNREFRQFLGTSPLKWLSQSTAFRTTVADHLLDGELGSQPLRSRRRAWSSGSV
jgi:AraC-like DNA-binding protein